MRAQLVSLAGFAVRVLSAEGRELRDGHELATKGVLFQQAAPPQVHQRDLFTTRAHTAAQGQNASKTTARQQRRRRK
jgi:hypothetical protein